MRKRKSPKYIYEIPYSKRLALCKILDGDGGWKILAGELRCSIDDINIWQMAFQRPGGSPTEEVLMHWGHRNATIKDLFAMLKKIKCIRGLQTLRGLVTDEMFESSQKTATQSVETSTCEAQQVDELAGSDDELPLPGFPSPHRHAVQHQYEAHTVGLSATNGHFPIPVASDSSKFSSDSFTKPSKNNPSFIDIQSMKENLFRQPVECQTESATLTAIRLGHTQRTTDLDKNLLANVMDQKGDLSSGEKLIPGEAIVAGEDGEKARKIEQRRLERERLKEVALLNVQQFSFKDILSATRNLSPENILGRGGFGVVYKGNLKSTPVAIKIINQRDEDEKDASSLSKQHFAEIQTVLRYPQVNIIPLFGLSLDGPKLCLVYQYMVNGSLEDRLACKNGTKPLDWWKRHNILTGSARGLQWLHNADEKPLIHGDIKSANILLDKNFEAKIADFGLAKQATGGGDSRYTHASRSKMTDKVFGSEAYLPEEFSRTLQHSIDTDTYSFGIVMFEACTGDKAYDERREGGKFLKDYVDTVFATENDEKLLQIRDPHTSHWPRDAWLALMKLGKTCASRMKRDRPKMEKVLRILEKIQYQCQVKMAEKEPEGPDPISLGNISEKSYHLHHTGSVQGHSLDAANQRPPPQNLQMAMELQKMHFEKLKDDQRFDPSEDPKFFVSDMQKLALIEGSADKVQNVPRPEDPDFYPSDPVKLAQLEQQDAMTMKSSHGVVSLEDARDQSVPYQLQAEFDQRKATGRVGKHQQEAQDQSFDMQQHQHPTQHQQYYVGIQGSQRLRMAPASHCNLDTCVPLPQHQTPMSTHQYVNMPPMQYVNASSARYANVPTTQPQYVNLVGGRQMTEDVQNMENEEREIIEGHWAMQGQRSHNLEPAGQTQHQRINSEDTTEILLKKKDAPLPDFLCGIIGDSPGDMGFEKGEGTSVSSRHCEEGAEVGSPPTHHTPDTPTRSSPPIYITAHTEK